MSVEPLLIFYGYPSLINQSRSLEEAARHFSRYKFVILGDGLQASQHPEHHKVAELLSGLPAVHFFGYVDLGVYSPRVSVRNLSLSQIAQACQAWAALGVRGVLLDDFGYDFANTRQRQRDAVALVHGLGLAVIANSWDPAHALGSQVCVANPKGLLSSLTPSDYFLSESYLIEQGQWVEFTRWRLRSQALQALCRHRPVQLLSCTTAGAQSYRLEDWHFVCAGAWLDGHRAVAWGEPHFSAADNLAPWRELPILPERGKVSRVAVRNARISVRGSWGRAEVDFVNKQFSLLPRPTWWKIWS